MTQRPWSRPCQWGTLFFVIIAVGCAETRWTGKLAFWERSAPKYGAHGLGILTQNDRVAALRELAEASDEQSAAAQQQISVNIASKFGSEKKPLVRVEMVRTLENYDTPTASQTLAQALRDADAEVRAAACEAWRKRGGEEAAHLLAEVLASDTDVDVRLAAVEALGELESSHVVPALAVALDDRDPALQYRAMQALENVTGQDLGYDVAQWRQYVQGGVNVTVDRPTLAQRFFPWL